MASASSMSLVDYLKVVVKIGIDYDLSIDHTSAASGPQCMPQAMDITCIGQVRILKEQRVRDWQVLGNHRNKVTPALDIAFS